MLAEVGLVAAGAVVEEVVGVEHAVAQELEAAAVHRIGARLDLQVHDAAERVAELRRVRARLELELVERVDAREEHHRLQPRLVVVHAVEHVVVVARPLPVRGERRRRAPREAARAVDVRAWYAADDARHRAREVDEVAAVQRQRLDLLLANRRAELGGGRLHERRRAGDRHRLLDRADLELDVDAHALIDAERNVGSRHRLEARELGLHRVGPRRQRRRRELAVAVGRDDSHEAGPGIGQGDRRARHDRAGRVGNQTEDGAGNRLRRSGGGKQPGRDEETQYRSLHLRPPCAGDAAPYDSTRPTDSAPRSMEIAAAAATTAPAMSLPASARGIR